MVVSSSNNNFEKEESHISLVLELVNLFLGIKHRADSKNSRFRLVNFDALVFLNFVFQRALSSYPAVNLAFFVRVFKVNTTLVKHFDI
jgi:hypothetical protein